MGLAITIGGILIKSGAWIGHQEVAISDIERLRKALQEDIIRIEQEIGKLRDWRHRLGEDPCASLLKLYEMLERDIAELRTAVFR